jgi:hypothetical protein
MFTVCKVPMPVVRTPGGVTRPREANRNARGRLIECGKRCEVRGMERAGAAHLSPVRGML